MNKPDNVEVSRTLEELGGRIELEGGNPYRARAYRRAAENLALSAVPVGKLIADGSLTDVPGVGEALAAVITEIYETGDYASAKAKKAIPRGVLEMLKVPGLRAEKIRKLHEDLGISSVAELERAAKSDLLASTKGYGAAFQAKVLQSIAISRGSQGMHIHRAAAALDQTISHLGRVYPNWSSITPAGEFRRACELVVALQVVAVDSDLDGEDQVIHQGEKLTVHVTMPERYGIALLFATGSEVHLRALSAWAKKQRLSLDKDGVRQKNRIIASRTEEDIYAALQLPFIPPELRETGREVEVAGEGRLPDLVTQDDIKGILHAHTLESDGSDTLEDMAKATRDRGFSYLGLTDHSQTAHYAGGLKPDEVIAQQSRVEKLNKRLGPRFHVFKGIESDILGDGSLDYPEDILKRFDLVVASVHSKFRLPKKQQTDRIIKAIENPHTTVLGHLTGRRLLKRPGYEVDMERILKACAKHGVAIEINAHPWRLDMDWRWCERALELGCIFSINPDAHSTDEIDNVRWGVLMARKGWVRKERVINAKSLSEFRKHLRTHSKRREQ